MDAKEIYRFPLKLDDSGVYIWTDNNVMDFDTLLGIDGASWAIIQSIVDVINGDRSGIFDAVLCNGIISIEGKNVLRVRGWGTLIGLLNMSIEDAIRIQDEFAKYCTQQLRRDLKYEKR